MPKPFPRVAKQFGKAVGQFDLINGADKILVPVDLDHPSLSLLFWLHHKSRKMPQHFVSCPVYFHSDPTPSPDLVSYLTEYAQKQEATIQFRQCSQPENKAALLKMYINTAIELQCNKVALVDSLDYITAMILNNMCTQGQFEGPPVKQEVKVESETGVQNITIIRPFAFLTDDEIEEFASKSELPNTPSGVHIAEDPSLSICRAAIQHVLDESSNTRMNMFKSQYAIQRKYMGVGEESIADVDAEDL